MNLAEIVEVLDLFDESGFDELLIEAEGIRICARRRAGEAAVATMGAARFGSAATRNDSGPSPSTAAVLGEGPLPKATRQGERIAVCAPIGGTFYRAPSPTAQPFAKAGSRVSADDCVGLIEVMKLFNQVRAGTAGEVLQVVCDDAAIVQAGDVLMYIRPAGTASAVVDVPTADSG